MGNVTSTNQGGVESSAESVVDSAIENVLRRRKSIEDQGSTIEPHIEDPEIMPPERLTDDIFRTVNAVRDAIVTMLKDADYEITIPMEQDKIEDETVPELGVPRSLLLALMASAKVALRWKKTEKNPVDAGIEFAKDLLKNMPAERVSLRDLQQIDPIWQGLESIRSDDTLVDTLERTLGSMPQEMSLPNQRRQHYHVAHFTHAPEAVHIDAIIRAMLARTKDLHTVFRSESPEGARAEMKAWTLWRDRIDVAAQTDAEAMLQIYKDVMVPRGDLLALSGMPSAILSAQKKIEESGGFLHPPTIEEMYQMLQSGYHTFTARDAQGLLGYTSVLTDADLVKKNLSEMCGYDPSVAYTSRNLPKKNLAGKNVEWLKKTFVAEVLNSADYLASSVEVAVAPNRGDKQRRTAGIATALKHAAYTEALHYKKTSVIVRHFEIVGVNSKKLHTGVKNEASKRFIMALGGEELGTYEECFNAETDLALKVLWHIWVCDLQKATNTIERFSK